MAHHHVDPSTLTPTPDHPCDRRSISDTLGLETLALATYELDPGEDLATTYHYHDHREEALYVVTGVLSVETPAETIRIEQGELFVAEPDTPHRPFNPPTADGPVRVLGTGAPAWDIGRPYDG